MTNVATDDKFEKNLVAVHLYDPGRQTQNVGTLTLLKQPRLGPDTINTVDPVDTVLLKALLQRGTADGKCDFEDIKAITESIKLDVNYLALRIRQSEAEERVRPVLQQFGIM